MGHEEPFDILQLYNTDKQISDLFLQPVPFHPTLILLDMFTKRRQLQIHEIFDVVIFHPHSLTLMLMRLFRLQGK